MCFSLAWLQGLCIDLVIIFAVVAIIKLLVPLLTSMIPGGGVVGQIITIVLWAIVAIFVIYIIFGLLSCLMGHGFTLLR